MEEKLFSKYYSEFLNDVSDWNLGKTYLNDLEYSQFQNMFLNERAPVKKKNS